MGKGETSSSDRLGNFVPAIVEKCMPKEAGSVSHTKVQAVLLFVDVVGFSKLSADLVAEHERGPEKTQRLLNALFTRLIDTIMAHGGGVATIAGDSLQAYWTLEQDSKQSGNALIELAKMAAKCAMEITTHDDTDRGVGRNLRIKALLDIGVVHLTAVGSSDESAFPILSGPLIESLPENSQSLQASTVLATPAFEQVLSDCAEFTENASGLAKLTRVETVAAETMPEGPRQKFRYVSPLARALVSGSDDDWVAEFRRATVLFAEFSQFAPRDAEGFAGFAKDVLSTIEGNGGAVVQFQADDKGLILVVGWGLAVSAFEDNAERAIHSGRAILEAAERVSIPCKVGISTGNLLCGLMGGSGYQQVAIMSESVNLASALAMRATAGLLVDAETQKLATRRFAFDDQGSFQPKGREDTIQVFMPTAEVRAVGHFGPEIVGRSAELKTLLDALDQTGSAPLLQVWGDAGLGKSHLGAVLAARLAARGLVIVSGYCDSLRRASAFHAWRKPIETLLDRFDADGAADRGAVLNSVIANAGMTEGQHVLLRQLLDLDIQVPAGLKALSPEERAQSVRDSIVSLLDTFIATQDMVLVFEDVHWMDSASWQVLTDVRQRLPQVTVLLLSRPVDQTELPVQAVRMLRDDSGAKVVLAPLGRLETDALICAELGITEQPPTMLDRIFELAEGHPLYTKELAKLFVDRGLIHIESGYAHIPSTKINLKELQFPGGIAGVVSARISALSPDVQLTLKVAAVLGRDADLDMLVQSHPQPDAKVSSHLDQIHASGLMEPVSKNKSRFHHALIVDTAYSMLLTDQRNALHRSIAVLYEDAIAAGTPNIPSPLVAHHWDKGGAPKEAFGHLRAAAEQASQTQANAEVVAFLTRALELDGNHGPLVSLEEAASLHMTLAAALMSLGHLVATDEHLKSALTIFHKAPPENTAAYVREMLAHFLRVILYRRNVDAPVQPNKLNAARIYLSLSEVYYDRQDTLRTLHATFSGMDLASASGGDSAPLALAMSQFSMVSIFMPWAVKGDYWKTAAIEMSERLNAPGSSGWVYMTTGAYTFAKARFDEAEALTRKAIDCSEEAGEQKCWEYSVANMGNILRLQGHFRKADVFDVQTYDSGHDRDVPQVKLWGVTGRLKNLWVLNEFDAFEENLARARSLITDDLNKLNSAASNTIAYHIFAGLDGIRQQNTRSALQDIMTAVDLFDGLHDPQIYMVDPVSYILDAGHALERLQADPVSVRRIFDVMARKSAKLVKLYPSANARLELARGDLAQHKGNSKAADKHWQKAVQEAERFQMPFDAAMAHNRLAFHSTGADIDTVHHTERMHSCLSELDLQTPEIWLV